MNDGTGIERPPLGIRLLHAVRKAPNWSTMTADELVAYRDAENRRRSSRLGRVITGRPADGVAIRWREVTLADREVRVREYRPSTEHRGDLPLVLHVHGGGFVGTAVQCDWSNSYFAASLPAVVVSVEHRLLAEGTPLSAAVDDGWEVLRHVVLHAAEWGVDPARTVVVGESTGGLIAALSAIRAKASGLHLRAQVLVNPVTDVTGTAFDHPSITQHADSPTLNMAQLRLFQRLAAPPGSDARAVSPLLTEDLGGLAPALVVVPTIDPLADHGRRYAERLLASGTPARLTEHPGAPHGFLSMPGLAPQAKAARTEIAAFLQDHLDESPSVAPKSKKAGRR
ncbi:alpha/beta hydrolase [Nocardia sp. NPDC050793]|uniref:alpha/beta hydrolase n=1 Tax=Nocardia sp. NPDC050793 TaxID=3155159 RepID=UPI0033FDB04B